MFLFCQVNLSGFILNEGRVFEIVILIRKLQGFTIRGYKESVTCLRADLCYVLMHAHKGTCIGGDTQVGQQSAVAQDPLGIVGGVLILAGPTGSPVKTQVMEDQTMEP